MMQKRPSTTDSEPELFLDAHLKTDLRRKSVRGAAVMLVAQWTRFVLQVGSAAILGRLLTPKDYGLVGMVTAVTSLFHVFEQLGLSSATIQQSKITVRQVSMLFWLNLASGAVIGLVLLGLAPMIAAFYGDDRLVWITFVLAATFVLGGAKVQHQALLKRQMRLTELAIIDLGSAFLGVAAGVFVAVQRGGYWALVAMYVTASLTSVIFTWLSCRWVPQLPSKGANVRGMVKFGAHLVMADILSYATRNLDNVLIGKVWGAGPLGLYSRAYGLLMLPLQQINSPLWTVAVPALSRLQSEPERFRKYYNRVSSGISFITFPLVMALAAVSEEVLWVVMGPQWTEAGKIFMVLAFAAMWQPLANTRGWVLVSLGRSKRMLQWACITTPLVILSFVVGLQWGPLGVATGYTALCFALVYPANRFMLRDTPIPLRDIFDVIWRPLLLGLAIFGTMWMFKQMTHFASPLWRLLSSLLAGMAVFLLAVGAWSGARKQAWELIELFKILKNSRKSREEVEGS